jgi:hypothetical protein
MIKVISPERMAMLGPNQFDRRSGATQRDGSHIT